MSQPPSSLPLYDGVAASYLQLPPGQWTSLLAFLCQRFTHVAPETWRLRLEQGRVFDQEGRPLAPDCRYQANQRIWYYREVEHEPVIPFEATILYRDQRLLVADKPHFLASVPGGRHVRETLLSRLRAALALPELTPVHRLDRETAGVMLFCCQPQYRHAYQSMFLQQTVQKQYLAIAGVRDDLALPLCYTSRLQERVDDFRMEEVAGEANSETLIELIERNGDWGRYRLTPKSGKKHQLRAHLAALGIGIHGDPWYPQRQADKPHDDFSTPLRLLAHSIRFVDPVDGSQRHYQSIRTLDWPQ